MCVKTDVVDSPVEPEICSHGCSVCFCTLIPFSYFKGSYEWHYPFKSLCPFQFMDGAFLLFWIMPRYNTSGDFPLGII